MSLVVEGANAAQVARYNLVYRRLERLRQLEVPLIDPTPVRLGRRLDQMLVTTPALDLLDESMLLMAEAVGVMLARRRRFAVLANQGVAADNAAQQAAGQVPQTGHTRQLVSMPPQEGKTTAISRYGLLWLLRRFPGLRLVLVSFDGANANRMSYMARGDIELFDGTAGNPDLGLRFARDQRAVGRWSLSNGGDVYAIGIGGGLTGRPVDAMIIDDPVKDDEAASSEIRSSKAWLWWQGVGRPRLAPDAPVMVLGTRWHEADLIGRMLEKQAEDENAGLAHYDRWRHLNVPAQADHDPARGETDVLGRQPGEFMASARGRTREEWETTKNTLTARVWTALYQGKPSPDEGTVWLEQWWRQYETPLWSQQPDGSFKVPGMDRLIWSWDMSFKDNDGSDYVCGQLWAKRGAEAFLVYSVWARLDFPKTQQAVVRGHALFPQAAPILIEDTANGPAVIASLSKVVPGIQAVKVPQRNKVARAEAVSPFVKAGNVWLPTPAVAMPGGDGKKAHPLTWDPRAFVHEAKAFPYGAHDDQVDAASQALAELYLGDGGPAKILRPVGRVPGVVRRDDPLAKLTPAQRRLHDAAFRR